MTFQNFNQVLLKNFEELGEQDAILFKKEGKYTSLTYSELKDIVFKIAAGILHLGLNPRDRTVVLSNTRAEWAFADLGCLLAGAITSGIYTSNLAEEAAYILNDLEAKFLFVENQEQLDKILSVKEKIPTIQKVFVFDLFKTSDSNWVMSLKELLQLGASHQKQFHAEIEKQAQTIQPDDILCIIYTSGTTGQPKGVMLTHLNYLFIMESILQAVKDISRIYRNLSFLPLAHSLERLGGYYFILYIGRTIGYAESLDTLLDNFKEVAPNIVTAVPRVFEKIYARITFGLQSASPIKRKLFNWALKVGEEYGEYKIKHQKAPGWLNFRHQLADKLIYRKVKAAFGGKMEFFISGGAPLSAEIARFFHSLDLLILEGWGLTETNAPSTLNRPDDYKLGSVGKPLPGVEIKVAEDGELLVKGDHVFKGYWKKPAETEEVFTVDGYFLTGDIGTIDEEGFVYITDRKKQLIITAGGKNIAPAPIEQLLLQGDHIDQAYIHGDRRKYLTALIVPNQEQIMRSAITLGIQNLSWEELLKHQYIKQIIQAEVDQANQKLPRYMQIKYFRLLPQPFTVETGELTPTLKQKKRVIEEKYKALLDEMYE